MDLIIVVLTLVFFAGLVSIVMPLRFLGIRSRAAGGMVTLVAFIACLIATSLLPPKPEANNVSRPQTAAAVTAKVLTVGETASARAPEIQKSFVAVIERGRNAFRAGSNDMQKGAARPSRANGICSIVGNMRLNNWVGQVEQLSSNNEGKGVLSIKIASDVYVKTWNNAMSDFADDTLLDPTSAVFSKASALKKGQWVQFSGAFRKGDVDCIRESSLSLSGSLTSLEFIFRFNDISPL